MRCDSQATRLLVLLAVATSDGLTLGRHYCGLPATGLDIPYPLRRDARLTALTCHLDAATAWAVVRFGARLRMRGLGCCFAISLLLSALDYAVE
jgi:hypothetical protein